VDVVDELRYMIVQMVKFAVGLHHHLVVYMNRCGMAMELSLGPRDGMVGCNWFSDLLTLLS